MNEREQGELLQLFTEIMRQQGVGDEDLTQANSEELKLHVLSEKIFEQRHPVIGIVGLNDVGKSSLGNALLGKLAFNAAPGWDITQRLANESLPSGMMVFDTPGFGVDNAELEQITRDFMKQCNLLIYVMRYPNLYQNSYDLYRKEILPLNIPTISVINVVQDNPEEFASRHMERVLSKVRTHIDGPLIVLSTQTGWNVDKLTLAMIDELGDEFHLRFEQALDKRFQKGVRNRLVLRYSAYAAAKAACTRVDETFAGTQPMGSKSMVNILTVGLCLKIAALYHQEFDEGSFVQHEANTVARTRHEIQLQQLKSPVEIPGVLLGAAGGVTLAQTTAVAALLGLPAGPLGVVALGGAAALGGGILGLIFKRTTFRQTKVALKGGADLAIAALSDGYATSAMMLRRKQQQQTRQALSPRDEQEFFERVYQEHYDTVIRDALDEITRKKLDSATEGDVVQLARRLSTQINLLSIFTALE